MENASMINLGRNKAILLLLASGIFAYVYAVCFNGVDVIPQLSFTVFCLVAFIALNVTLDKLGYLVNNRAVKWAIPIVAVSLFNSIFHESLFTYGNVIMVHILFSIYAISAMQTQPQELFSMNTFKKVGRTIFSNWFAFVDVIKEINNSKVPKAKSDMAKKIAMGVCFAFPVLFILVYLLASADIVFGRLINDFVSGIFSFNPPNISFIVTIVFVWIFAVGYVIQAQRNCKRQNVEGKIIHIDVTMGATFLTMINLVFAVFSYVQIVYLFHGGFMKLPDGVVYSEYAREGFFQLLLVTIINFSVIVVFISFYKNTTNSKLLKFLLFMLCAFTCVLIASSFYRMFLYIDFYGHTTLRLRVITFLVMEVCLIAITVSRLFVETVPFGKWFIMTSFVFYLIVNVTGTDYTATKLNINRVIANKQLSLDIAFCEADGMYLIKNAIDNGQLKREQLSDSYGYRQDILPLYEVIIEDKYYFTEWQNWSYFKAKAFKGSPKPGSN